MNSFARIATVTASIKRTPGLVDGKRGEPVTHITSLACTPLDPVDPELRHNVLDTPGEILQTFVEGIHDVREGDVLVVNGNEFPIKSCAEWAWRNAVLRHLIVEEPRR